MREVLKGKEGRPKFVTQEKKQKNQSLDRYDTPVRSLSAIFVQLVWCSVLRTTMIKKTPNALKHKIFI